ncbi:MAG TPA: hypothetical protein VMM17_01445 [Gemmatimonadaceae bacterium]|nr:hypothetical protein [Gemmatimonadaceae bacterium]
MRIGLALSFKWCRHDKELPWPVTAKLSRSFYDKLGDDVASELVDWFNAVDSDYKNDLKEINDRNWERFKGELGAHRSEVRAELGMIRAEFGQFRAEIQSILAAQRSELIKWMFVFWSGTVIPVVGMLIAVIAPVK